MELSCTDLISNPHYLPESILPCSLFSRVWLDDPSWKKAMATEEGSAEEGLMETTVGMEGLNIDFR